MEVYKPTSLDRTRSLKHGIGEIDCQKVAVSDVGEASVSANGDPARTIQADQR